MLYEGAPDWPEKDRFWAICERYGVTIFYTAPTAIRAFMKWGNEYPARYDLSRLRLLGSVGEPINPEAWMWYREHIGGDRCPVVDTWWQTETGGIVISPLPGVTATKPGSGVITWPPVSVCQNVSTMGQRSPPTFRWYHIHASGLIGSPTVPSTRNDDRSWPSSSDAPHFM